jgi:hypothetical protein
MQGHIFDVPRHLFNAVIFSTLPASFLPERIPPRAIGRKCERGPGVLPLHAAQHPNGITIGIGNLLSLFALRSTGRDASRVA